MHRSRLALAALAAAVAVATACTTPPAPPARYALVYGVSRYVAAPEGRFPNLTYGDDDARSMADLLAADGYTVTFRTDADASKAALVADLAAAGAVAAPDDLVLLYFSGHGGALADFGLDASAAASESPESRWIFPYGAIDPGLSGGSLAPSDIRLSDAVSDAEISKLMAALPCARRIVIIDACNSGGFIAAGADADALPPDNSEREVVDRGAIFVQALRAYAAYGGTPPVDGVLPSNATVISAAGADEQSYETASVRHGVFTYFLLEAATRGDLDGDGVVSCLEAYAYAAAGVEATWNALSGASRGYQFMPHISGGAVDLALFGAS